LTGLLIEAKQSGLDVGSPPLLARYQRTAAAGQFGDAGDDRWLDRLFSTNNPLLRLARDLGIAAVDRTRPVKRVFMRQAMGV